MNEAPDPVDAFSLLSGRKDDPASLKRLRFAVVGMGVLLAVGFTAVIGRIFYLMTRTPPPAASSEGAVAVPAGDITLALPAGARAIQQNVSGSLLSVLFEGPDGQGIVIFDLKTGREAAHVRLQPRPK